MDQGEQGQLLEVAVQSFSQVKIGIQNRIFNSGTIRPECFPSDSLTDWVQWKPHFVAAAEANRWTQTGAISVLPECLNGPALNEFKVSLKTQEVKFQVPNHMAPALRALFGNMDQTMGVMRNDRAGRNGLKSLVQKECESLREFARRVRSLGMLVFGHLDADQRDELFRERFLDRLLDSDLLGVLLREPTRGFVGTVDRADDLESIATSARTGQSRLGSSLVKARAGADSRG